MKVIGVDLLSIPGVAAGAAPLLTCIAGSWFANPRSFERWFTLTRPKPWPGASRRRHTLGGSLALWALACGAAVIVLHHATSDVGLKVGAYRTGIATVLLFALAAVIAMHRRIAMALPHRFGHAASQQRVRQNLPSQSLSNTPSPSWSIRPKTWQRIHIALAIGAGLPLWWHCDLGRASAADLLVKTAAMLLLTTGFLGIAITDLSRWRLLSPKFSPRLSAALIDGLFAVHRGLAVLTFILITIHVLAVLYFAGV
jgi:hypothetical protein